jgi:hypothetical protein
MRRLFALGICALAVLLPWRLRLLLGSALGWGAQGFYLATFCLTRVMVRALKKGAAQR